MNTQIKQVAMFFPYVVYEKNITKYDEIIENLNKNPKTKEEVKDIIINVFLEYEPYLGVDFIYDFCQKYVEFIFFKTLNEIIEFHNENHDINLFGKDFVCFSLNII